MLNTVRLRFTWRERHADLPPYLLGKLSQARPYGTKLAECDGSMGSWSQIKNSSELDLSGQKLKKGGGERGYNSLSTRSGGKGNSKQKTQTTKHQKRNTKHKTKRRKKMIMKLINFFKDEEGATMVEYGLMVALIAVVCIAAITLIGTNLRDNIFAVIAAAL